MMYRDVKLKSVNQLWSCNRTTLQSTLLTLGCSLVKMSSKFFMMEITM